MPTVRFTVPKPVWAKLTTKLDKKPNHPVTEELRKTRMTRSSGGDVVLWEPSGSLKTTLLTALSAQLEAESRFHKKCRGNEELKATVEKLKTLTA